MCNRLAQKVGRAPIAPALPGNKRHQMQRVRLPRCLFQHPPAQTFRLVQTSLAESLGSLGKVALRLGHVVSRSNGQRAGPQGASHTQVTAVKVKGSRA